MTLLDQVTIQLVRETCCECGVVFAMSKDLNQRRRDTHDWFYCPNGHQQYYPGQTRAEKAEPEAGEVYEVSLPIMDGWPGSAVFLPLLRFAPGTRVRVTPLDGGTDG